MDCFTDVFTTFLNLGTFQLCCCLWRVRHLNLCSEDERRSYRFGTSVCDASRILFFAQRKQKYFFPPELRLPPFQRVPQLIRTFSPPNVNNADYFKYVLRYSPKWLGGEEWLSKLLFLFFCEMYLRKACFHQGKERTLHSFVPSSSCSFTH